MEIKCGEDVCHTERPRGVARTCGNKHFNDRNADIVRFFFQKLYFLRSKFHPKIIPRKKKNTFQIWEVFFFSPPLSWERVNFFKTFSFEGLGGRLVRARGIFQQKNIRASKVSGEKEILGVECYLRSKSLFISSIGLFF